ncbi:MAG: heavy-metal-associated domain-containing protein [Thermodesulfobacteriota bacterium]
MATRTIEVKGMSCNHCVQSVTQALSALEGVSGVKVDLLGGTATYEETTPVPEADVKAAIENIGFTAGNYR